MEHLFAPSEAQASHRGSPYNVVWVESGCWAANPAQINHFALFNAIPNAPWKGCVEARPEPFDVLDTPPSTSNPDTLFVPYFWADDVDGRRVVNNFMDDDLAAFPNTNYPWNGWGRTLSVFKYRGVPGNIDNVAPVTLGPNQSCPTELLPLTNNRGTVVSRIREMAHWEGSGTVIPEGIGWGWRTLSPTIPFTEGAPYGDANKIIVLMTDGLNAAAQNRNDVFRSDYTAYNAIGLWRYWRPSGGPDIDNLDEMGEYIDERTREVCENAKDEDVEIYTVVFREPDENVRSMLRECATSNDHAFTAETSADLMRVFGAISTSIAQLRLTR